MVATFPSLPGYSQGFYPEREEPDISGVERLLRRIFHFNSTARRLKSIDARRSFVDRVDQCNKTIESFGGEDINQYKKYVQRKLAIEKLSNDTVAESFALVRQIAANTIGMRHYDSQLVGGWIIMNGCIAEMETGEGKTLTATLPAATAALAGIPVHIITANDYLAERDATSMAPIYEALGLTVGVIQESHDAITRKTVYRSDISYCSSKQIAFDYLKDRLILGEQNSRSKLRLEGLVGGESNIDRLLLRGLVYAIVDEADSVMVDEARTPLILSVPNRTDQRILDYQKAFKIAEQLVDANDYSIVVGKRTVRLTDSGLQRLSTLAEPLDGIWASKIYREELVGNALKALHVFKKDVCYVVKDNKIQIVDEFTGRTMPDRSWNSGLHQMIQMKEGCEVEPEKETIARTCYQRFFQNYLTLSGMTGTAMEIRKELKAVYDVDVVQLPTRKKVKRVKYPDQVFRTERRKWAAVVERIEQVTGDQRPVLIGTRSVAASEHLHDLLAQRGIAHQTLNAKQDSCEAAIIASAGVPGNVTVATNMAGRGTDIKLAGESINRGGLHVIATERHEARRIDRQLFGRCARQGEPGTTECILSLDDQLIRQYCPGVARWLLTGYRPISGKLPQGLVWLLFYLTQRNAEKTNSRIRNDLLKMDRRMETLLAFSGKFDF